MLVSEDLGTAHLSIYQKESVKKFASRKLLCIYQISV